MRAPASLLLAAALLGGPLVLAHSERAAHFPEGDGLVPEYRTDGPYLVACKPDSLGRLAGYAFADLARNLALLGECRHHGFEHLQAAVDAVPGPGSRILLLPGVYQEEPSVARYREASGQCAELKGQRILEYEQHVQCPNLQNLVAILGDDPADEDAKCIRER